MSNQFVRHGFGMWILASFFYAYQYVLRLLPNITMVDLMQQYQIDAQIFGQLNGLYYIAYALVHIPLGLMLDRIGPKIILPGCMLLCGLGLLPFIISDNWIYPCIGRVLIGVGSSGAILGIFKIIRIAYREELFAKMLGFSVTIGLVGAICGGWPVHWLLKHYGWQWTFKCLAMIAFMLAIMTWLMVPKVKTIKTNITQDIKQIFSKPEILTICILAGLMVGPLEGFADGWSGQFLQVVYGLSDNLAATYPSMIFLGMGIGAPILPMLTRHQDHYYPMIALSAVMMAVCFLLLLSASLPVSLIGATLFVVGFFCAYQILAISKAGMVAGAHLAGLTTAMANMIIMPFGYLFHAGVGSVMTFVWDGQMINGAPQYSVYDYASALSVIPITLTIAFVGFIALYVKKRNRLQIHSQVCC